MRVHQPASYLHHHARGAQGRQWDALDHHVERLPVEQLHHQKWHAVVSIHVVDGHDVLVVQLGGGLGFTLQQRRQLLERHAVALQNELDCHGPIEVRVNRAKDVTHATLTELLHDLEAAAFADSLAAGGRYRESAGRGVGGNREAGTQGVGVDVVAGVERLGAIPLPLDSASVGAADGLGRAAPHLSLRGLVVFAIRFRHPAALGRPKTSRREFPILADWTLESASTRLAE